MEDGEIERLAAESEESKAERARYTEKLSVLEKGMRDLRRLDKHRVKTEVDNPTDAEDSDDTYAGNDNEDADESEEEL